MTIKTARAALNHSAFTGISRNHLDRLVTELADPFDAAREGRLYRRRGSRDHRRYPGAGRRMVLTVRDRALCTLAWLRLSLPHQALAVPYGVDRSTISAAVRQIIPLLANRGFATPTGVRLHILADVLAYAAAEGLVVRLDGTEIQVRRPGAHRPGRRAFVSGKRKQNTIKSTIASDARGRPMWAGATRPGRVHNQTAVKTEGIDDLLHQFPDVKLLVDSGYRGLANDHPGQVIATPRRPKKDAPPDQVAVYEAARKAQSSQRIPADIRDLLTLRDHRCPTHREPTPSSSALELRRPPKFAPVKTRTGHTSTASRPHTEADACHLNCRLPPLLNELAATVADANKEGVLCLGARTRTPAEVAAMQAVTRAAESPELTICKAKAVDTGGPLIFVTGGIGIWTTLRRSRRP